MMKIMNVEKISWKIVFCPLLNQMSRYVKRELEGAINYREYSMLLVLQMNVYVTLRNGNSERKD